MPKSALNQPQDRTNGPPPARTQVSRPSRKKREKLLRDVKIEKLFLESYVLYMRNQQQ